MMKDESKSQKKNIMLVLTLAFVIIQLSLASAYFWAEFHKGDFIDFCVQQDRTCGSTKCGPFCMTFDDINQCYTSHDTHHCFDIPPSNTTQGNTTFDINPPNLTVFNPVNNGIYNKTVILFNLKVNEESKLSYFDNINGNGRWTTLCSSCLSYNKSRSLKEGFNNLTIKAEDVVGNNANTSLIFFIDSKKPLITKSGAYDKKFASGNFSVEFKEDNPLFLILNFGNNVTGFQSQEIDIENECTSDKGRYKCNTFSDLGSYNGQEITYWFNLTDIAGFKAASKPVKVKVDTIDPIINNPNSFYNVSGRKVMFNISITELNFDRIEYKDHSVLKPRWNLMCSSLRNGICTKTISFSPGNHSIEIKVKDKAGNVATLPHPDLNLA